MKATMRGSKMSVIAEIPTGEIPVGFVKGEKICQGERQNKRSERQGAVSICGKNFKPGDFICDYSEKKAKKDWGEERNASLGIGCYCLDASYNNEDYVFDAAASINDPGRYINHASRNCNLILMQPAMIGEPPKSHWLRSKAGDRCWGRIIL